MTKLTEIEGVAASNAKKLQKAGIRSAEALLKKGATKKGRKEIAAKTGISEKVILRWVNYADLFRIKGVGGEYAELLEAAGVDTVPELSRRKPANLAAKMAEVNAKKHLVRQVPSEKQVSKWVDQAKTLDRVVKH